MSAVLYPSLLAAVVIDGSNDTIRLDEGGVVVSVVLPHGSFYCRGDGSTFDLLTIIITALSAAFAGGNVYSLGSPSWDINPANLPFFVTIGLSSGATAWRIKWADTDALTTFSPADLGYTAVTRVASAGSYTGTLAPRNVWVGNDVARARLRPKNWETAEEETADADNDVVRRAAKSRIDTLQLRWLHENRCYVEALNDPTVNNGTNALESFIDYAGDGRPVELHERTLSSGTILNQPTDTTLVGGVASTGKFRVGRAAQMSFDPQLVDTGLPFYNLDLVLVQGIR